MEQESMLLLGYVLIIVQVIGLLMAVHAVMTVRTAQGALAWAIALTTLPVLTLLPYLVFGRSRFAGYVRSRRQADLAMRKALRERNWRPCAAEAAAAEQVAVSPNLRALSKLVHLPALVNNQLHLLINGEATFAAIFEAIKSAEQVVLVQFFIVHDDALGRRLQAALLERAAAGVAVYLLYDSVGSHALPKEYSQRLRAGGVHVKAFAARRGLQNRYQLNFRNHRKLVVVDGLVGFVGGHNVGDEYLGLQPPLAPWRDTHVQVRGPVLASLQQSFAEDWFWAAGELSPLLPVQSEAAGSTLCQLVSSGPADDQETCSLFFVTAINAATQRLWITSPYFVPDEAVFAALRLAVLRGVDVRILLPSRPDHRLVFAASSLYAAEAVKAGVRVFRYQPGFLHQKVLLIDQDAAVVGSANLDNRSFRLNFELMLVAVDRVFAGEVEQMLLADFAQSREQLASEQRNVHRLQQLGMRVARLLSPVL